MKKFLSLLIAPVLFLVSLLGGCNKPEFVDPALCGARHDYSDVNAKKEIDSHDIEDFECEFSYYGEIFERRNYYVFSMKKSEDNKKAEVSVKRIEGYGEDYQNSFTTDVSKLGDLEKLIREAGLSKLNGEMFKTDGLPPNIGYKLSVLYASQEKIIAYDNSSNRLPDDAQEKLITFFEEFDENLIIPRETELDFDIEAETDTQND